MTKSGDGIDEIESFEYLLGFSAQTSPGLHGGCKT